MEKSDSQAHIAGHMKASQGWISKRLPTGLMKGLRAHSSWQTHNPRGNQNPRRVLGPLCRLLTRSGGPQAPQPAANTCSPGTPPKPPPQQHRRNKHMGPGRLQWRITRMCDNSRTPLVTTKTPGTPVLSQSVPPPTQALPPPASRGALAHRGIPVGLLPTPDAAGHRAPPPHPGQLLVLSAKYAVLEAGPWGSKAGQGQVCLDHCGSTDGCGFQGWSWRSMAGQREPP